MWRLIFCFAVLFSAPAGAASAQGAWRGCLPAGVKAEEVASVERGASGGVSAARRVTVGQKLKQLKARCRAGALSDARGRQIRFYRLKGCWGNPPDDYQEILSRQQKELSDLRRRFTVIEIACDTGDEPMP